VLNNFNFDDLFISLNGQFYPTLKDALDASAPIIKVGSFINVCIDFLITAVAIFFLIKFVNRMEDVIEDLTDDDADEEVVEATPEPEPVPEPEPTTEERLLEVLEKLSAQLDKA
ncbi:MAG: hypothetical protein F4063_07940, partial [Chloroflexi bacterium]|nr:hypothetical protein [Chloroflexota bacterium]